MVDTGAYSIYRNGEPKGKRGLQEINTNAKYVLTHAMLLHASVVGKTNWFIKNPYNKEYIRAEDYELWCRTFQQSNFGRIKEPLYLVREGKINVKNYLRSSKTIRKIIQHYWQGILSPYEFKKAVFTLHTKETAYKLFSIINMHHLLVNTRNEHLTKDEKQKVSDIIAKIERTNIYAVHAKGNISI